jgi:transposase-like protein
VLSNERVSARFDDKSDDNVRKFESVQVEVSGRYSNHADQGKRIHQVLQLELSGPPKAQHSNPETSPRRLSPEELGTLFKSYERGTPVNTLAREFSIHRSTVLDHLNRSTARRRYPALDDKGVQLAKQLYRAGLSLRDVGLTLEVHASTVRSVLLNAGVPLRDRQGRPGG